MNKCLLITCDNFHDDYGQDKWASLIAAGVLLHPGGHHSTYDLADKMKLGAYDKNGFFTDEATDDLFWLFYYEEKKWRESFPKTEFAWKRAIGLIPDRKSTKLSVEEVKEKIDIVELVEQYTKLRGRGDKFMGRCPLHDEKNASFSVDRAKGMWHCFAGCGGGDAITFIMKKCGKNFLESLDIARELV